VTRAARPKKRTQEEPPPPCPRCLKLAWAGLIRAETVMPLPAKCPPLAEDGSGPCCHDCQAADVIGKVVFTARKQVWGTTEPGGHKHPLQRGMPFDALRIVIGNERQEQLRLPEALRPCLGLVAQGLVRASVGEKALDEHHAWLESVGINLDNSAEDSA
jgi:hypothetical protein